VGRSSALLKRRRRVSRGAQGTERGGVREVVSAFLSGEGSGERLAPLRKFFFII